MPGSTLGVKQAMVTFMRRSGTVALIGLAVLSLPVPAAYAQFFRQRTLPVYAPGINPNAPFYNRVNPFTYVAPGVSSQQALYNYFQAARAASALPPWWYGYNPYPAPIISTGPVVPYSNYSSPYTNPYASMYYPLVPTPSFYANPYASLLSPSFGY
jgi:hypothetical protein